MGTEPLYITTDEYFRNMTGALNMVCKIFFQTLTEALDAAEADKVLSAAANDSIRRTVGTRLGGILDHVDSGINEKRHELGSTLGELTT